MIQTVIITEETPSKLTMSLNNWLKDWPEDKIIDVKYKEVTTDKKTDLKSLQFPVYLGIRFDKNIPDDEI